MSLNCDHGIYLGEGCHYCTIQEDHRKSSGIYGIRVGISSCLNILKNAKSLEAAIHEIKLLKAEELINW